MVGEARWPISSFAVEFANLHDEIVADFQQRAGRQSDVKTRLFAAFVSEISSFPPASFEVAIACNSLLAFLLHHHFLRH